MIGFVFVQTTKLTCPGQICMQLFHNHLIETTKSAQLPDPNRSCFVQLAEIALEISSLVSRKKEELG
jgi:hypothetical protein